MPSSDYDNLIRRLFRIDNVRYAVVIDDFGNRMAGGMKEGVRSTTPEDVERRLEVQAILILRMAEAYEKYDGRLSYSAIRWEKLFAYFFILSRKRALALTIEGSAPLNRIEEIVQMVDSFRKQSKED